VTQAYARERTSESLWVPVIDGKIASGGLPATIPAAAYPLLARVGSGRLVIDRDLSFTWNDIELDPGRLRAGAELVGAVASAMRNGGIGGVYR
jgi:hypothetical protein